MPLLNLQYDQIMRKYEETRLHNKHVQDEHVQEIYDNFPRVQEIDQAIASLSSQKVKSLLLGDGQDTVDLRQEISNYARERRSILSGAGYPTDYLELHYNCPLCEDTGYINGQKCSCFKKACTDLLYEHSNLDKILEKENFDHFNLDYYSDTIRNEATGLTAYDTAQLALNKARSFVQDFNERSGNLFLYGDTGVGKTFLSHCISRELLDLGKSVIYFSSFDLFDELAAGTFSKKGAETKINDYIFDCDLLIIDDLGTELTNSFVASQLFLLINERLINRKSTIISTNLSLENFSDTYSERVFSRIVSGYDMIKLIGKDIRIQQRMIGGKQ